jgi:3-dehydroquinate dehydratase
MLQAVRCKFSKARFCACTGALSHVGCALRDACSSLQMTCHKIDRAKEYFDNWFDSQLSPG